MNKKYSGYFNHFFFRITEGYNTTTRDISRDKNPNEFKGNTGHKKNFKKIVK